MFVELLKEYDRYAAEAETLRAAAEAKKAAQEKAASEAPPVWQRVVARLRRVDPVLPCLTTVVSVPLLWQEELHISDWVLGLLGVALTLLGSFLYYRGVARRRADRRQNEG